MAGCCCLTVNNMQESLLANYGIMEILSSQWDRTKQGLGRFSLNPPMMLCLRHYANWGSLYTCCGGRAICIRLEPTHDATFEKLCTCYRTEPCAGRCSARACSTLPARLGAAGSNPQCPCLLHAPSPARGSRIEPPVLQVVGGGRKELSQPEVGILGGGCCHRFRAVIWQ